MGEFVYKPILILSKHIISMVSKIHCEKGPKLNKLSTHEKPIFIDVIWIVNHSIKFTPMTINLFLCGKQDLISCFWKHVIKETFFFAQIKSGCHMTIIVLS